MFAYVFCVQNKNVFIIIYYIFVVSIVRMIHRLVSIRQLMIKDSETG